MDRDPILLTPGPLTTTLRTKLAMLKDWGSLGRRLQRRDRRACAASCWTSCTATTRMSSCRCRAAAPSASRPRWPRVVPRDGHVLVLDNGAYCKRAGQADADDGPQGHACWPSPRTQPVSAAALDARLKHDPVITHVVLIHCETGTGVLNPLAEVAAVCERHGKGLIVDAMSSFGALPIDARKMRFDALVAASGKCLEGVPGMGFVFLRKAVLDACAGNSQSLAMDLHDQYVYMEKTGQWRFTPPTHVMVALAEAVAQFVEEGGQPARLARYTDNCRTLVDGMTALGFKPFLQARGAGADHRHLPRAGAPGLRLQALLRRRPSSAASSSTRAS